MHIIVPYLALMKFYFVFSTGNIIFIPTTIYSPDCLHNLSGVQCTSPDRYQETCGMDVLPLSGHEHDYYDPQCIQCHPVSHPQWLQHTSDIGCLPVPWDLCLFGTVSLGGGILPLQGGQGSK